MKRKAYLKPEATLTALSVPVTMRNFSTWDPSDGSLDIVEGNPDEGGDDPYGGDESAKHANPWLEWED